MDFNQSSIVQHTSDDGSVDYTVDWKTFSFKEMLETRKDILKQHLQAFKLCAKATAANTDDTDVIIKSQEYNRSVYLDLLNYNKNVLSKYDVLVNEYKSLEEIFDNLSVKNNSLKNNIIVHEEEESTLRKEYQLEKVALSKAIEMYSTHFNLDLNIKNISDNIYEASLQFRKIKRCPITVQFTIDRAKRKVIEFIVDEGLSSAEEEDLRKHCYNLTNLPGLLCALQNIAVNKLNG